MTQTRLDELVSQWHESTGGKVIAIANMRHFDNGIGYKGKLLFDNDMQFFKLQTKGHSVLVGRATADSIRPDWLASGKLLPERRAYVASKDLGLLSIGPEVSGNDLYVIGGASVYRQCLRYCDQVMLTRTFDFSDQQADTFFPVLQLAAFELQGVGPVQCRGGLTWQTELWVK